MMGDLFSRLVERARSGDRPVQPGVRSPFDPGGSTDGKAQPVGEHPVDVLDVRSEDAQNGGRFGRLHPSHDAQAAAQASHASTDRGVQTVSGGVRRKAGLPDGTSATRRMDRRVREEHPGRDGSGGGQTGDSRSQRMFAPLVPAGGAFFETPGDGITQSARVRVDRVASVPAAEGRGPGSVDDRVSAGDASGSGGYSGYRGVEEAADAGSRLLRHHGPEVQPRRDRERRSVIVPSNVRAPSYGWPDRGGHAPGRPGPRSEGERAPEVTVTIGSVEVKAVMPGTQLRRTEEVSPREPVLTLDTYLERRSEGGT